MIEHRMVQLIINSTYVMLCYVDLHLVPSRMFGGDGDAGSAISVNDVPFVNHIQQGCCNLTKW